MTVLRDKGGFLSPVIRLVDHEGRSAVLKDYRTKNALTRGLLAPVLVRREFEILRHLDGVPGIPRAFAVLDGRALLTEHIPGRHPGRFPPGELPDETYRRLAATVREMHQRGVVHLDLRQKKNILIDDRDGRPWIIDFANSILVRARSPLAGLLRQLIAVDEGALVKFKARYWPRLVTDADRATLKRNRFLRRFWIFSPHTDRPKDQAW